MAGEAGGIPGIGRILSAVATVLNRDECMPGLRDDALIPHRPGMWVSSAAAYALLLACSLLAAYPLFHAGLFRGVDVVSLEFVRVAEYIHSLREGGFPVRWGANLEGGHGYPIFDFFPPLFMLIAGSLAIVGGVSVLGSVKITLFVLTLASGVGMYWFSREHFGNRGGLFAASLYVLFPYHFLDVFFRGAFAEFTALAIVPFVFYSLFRFLRDTQPSPATLLALTLSGALFVLSHNLSVLMYAPLLLLYTLGLAPARQKLCALAVALSLVSALTAFYTLPLMFERKFVQMGGMTTGKFDVLNNLLPLDELIGLWAMPLSWWALALIALGITVHFRNRIPRPTFAILCGFILGLFVLVFLITPASKAVWGMAEVFKWLQFPWRLLSPAAFLVCFIAGAIVYLPSENIKRALMAGFVSLAVATLIPLLSMVVRGPFVSIPDEALSPAQIRKQWLSATILSEYRPVWVKEKPAAPVADRLTASRPDTDIQRIEESPHSYIYKITIAGETVLTAHLFYFPGWKAYVNGNAVRPHISRQGLMQFSLPKGRFRIELKFWNTPVRILGNGLSLAGLLALGWISFRAAKASGAQRCR